MRSVFFPIRDPFAVTFVFVSHYFVIHCYIVIVLLIKAAIFNKPNTTLMKSFRNGTKIKQSSLNHETLKNERRTLSILVRGQKNHYRDSRQVSKLQHSIGRLDTRTFTDVTLKSEIFGDMVMFSRYAVCLAPDFFGYVELRMPFILSDYEREEIQSANICAL